MEIERLKKDGELQLIQVYTELTVGDLIKLLAEFPPEMLVACKTFSDCGRRRLSALEIETLESSKEHDEESVDAALFDKGKWLFID